MREYRPTLGELADEIKKAQSSIFDELVKTLYIAQMCGWLERFFSRCKCRLRLQIRYPL